MATKFTANRAATARGLFTALRVASRPGGPSLAARAAALPRLVAATARGEYPRASLGRLALLAAAAGYLLSPVDFVPEAILGPLGLADDAVLLAWLASQLVGETEDYLAWEQAPGDRPSGRAARAPETVPGTVIR